jgi:hypothetical protein
VSQPRVEILYFDGCPNAERARVLVETIAAELELEPNVQLVPVADPDKARALRFLGSPTVRVNGLDVEPGAEGRRDFVYSCRVYRIEHGFNGTPSEAWVREALARASNRR